MMIFTTLIILQRIDGVHFAASCNFMIIAAVLDWFLAIELANASFS